MTSNEVYGISHKPCALQSKVFLAEVDRAVSLEYEFPMCGQVDVSAWRDGAFDNDALNLRFMRPERGHKNLPVPKACAKQVTPETGTPVFFSLDGASAFGLSTRPSTFRDKAPLAIWVYNPTDKEVGVMSCEDLDGFFVGGFDVLDQSDNRVLARDEVQAQRQTGENAILPLRQLTGCTRNFPIPIPAHSCVHGNLDQTGYDFLKPLGSLYTLPAGHY